MSLDQDSYDFEGFDSHGIVTAEGTYTPRLLVGEYIGVDGEQHLTGGLGGVTLSCDFIMDEYDTRNELAEAIGTLRGKSLELTGTLTQTISADVTTFPNCTFMGFECEPIRQDGKNNKWFVRGRLRWRQRKRS